MSDAYVYFIQADENGPIKIGFTSDDPKKRLSQLQTANPATLKLLGAICGTTAKERELHTALAEWRMQGEWFQSHPTVLETIQAALSSSQEPEHTCDKLHCSFCGGCQDNSLVLIAGPDDIYICNACVAICAEIVAKQLFKTADAIFSEDEMDMGYAA